MYKARLQRLNADHVYRNTVEPFKVKPVSLPEGCQGNMTNACNNSLRKFRAAAHFRQSFPWSRKSELDSHGWFLVANTSNCNSIVFNHRCGHKEHHPSKDAFTGNRYLRCHAVDDATVLITVNYWLQPTIDRWVTRLFLPLNFGDQRLLNCLAWRCFLTRVTPLYLTL